MITKMAATDAIRAMWSAVKAEDNPIKRIVLFGWMVVIIVSMLIIAATLVVLLVIAEAIIGLLTSINTWKMVIIVLLLLFVATKLGLIELSL